MKEVKPKRSMAECIRKCEVTEHCNIHAINMCTLEEFSKCCSRKEWVIKEIKTKLMNLDIY